jgi:hypothetical protein
VSGVGKDGLPGDQSSRGGQCVRQNNLIGRLDKGRKPQVVDDGGVAFLAASVIVIAENERVLIHGIYGRHSQLG